MVTQAWSREELGMDMYVQNVPNGDRKTGIDSGTASRIREITPPAIEWDRDYGSGRPLWQDGQDLLLLGYEPDEAATELRLSYGRQCQCSGDELVTAIRDRGGDTMAQTDWRTPGTYGDEHETRALWEIAAEMHDQDGLEWSEIAEELDARYGVSITGPTVRDRVYAYQGRSSAVREMLDWQTPGIYHERALVEIAAEQREAQRTWQEIADYLEEHCGVEVHFATVSSQVRNYVKREEEGANGGLPPPTPLSGDDAPPQEDAEEDPFDDGGEGEPGPEDDETADGGECDLLEISGEELITRLAVEVVQRLIDRSEPAHRDECALEIHVPGVDLYIRADGPVEYMQRVMQVGSQLTLARQIALPAIRDDQLARLDAMEDLMGERGAQA